MTVQVCIFLLVSTLSLLWNTGTGTENPTPKPTNLPFSQVCYCTPACPSLLIQSLSQVFPASQSSPYFNEDTGNIVNSRRLWSNGPLFVFFSTRFQDIGDWIITNGTYNMITLDAPTNLTNNPLPGNGHHIYDHFPSDNIFEDHNLYKTLIFTCDASLSKYPTPGPSQSPTTSPPSASPTTASPTYAPTAVCPGLRLHSISGAQSRNVSHRCIDDAVSHFEGQYVKQGGEEIHGRAQWLGVEADVNDGYHIYFSALYNTWIIDADTDAGHGYSAVAAAAPNAYLSKYPPNMAVWSFLRQTNPTNIPCQATLFFVCSLTAVPTKAPTHKPTTAKPSTRYPSSMPTLVPSAAPTLAPTDVPSQPPSLAPTASPVHNCDGLRVTGTYFLDDIYEKQNTSDIGGGGALLYHSYHAVVANQPHRLYALSNHQWIIHAGGALNRYWLSLSQPVAFPPLNARDWDLYTGFSPFAIERKTVALHCLASLPPSNAPTLAPTLGPSDAPSLTPSQPPSFSPSAAPSDAPTDPTGFPTFQPSSLSPTGAPSAAPSLVPSSAPSLAPSFSPSAAPSSSPSQPPTASPSFQPCFGLYFEDLDDASFAFNGRYHRAADAYAINGHTWWMSIALHGHGHLQSAIQYFDGYWYLLQLRDTRNASIVAFDDQRVLVAVNTRPNWLYPLSGVWVYAREYEDKFHDTAVYNANVSVRCFDTFYPSPNPSDEPTQMPSVQRGPIFENCDGATPFFSFVSAAEFESGNYTVEWDTPRAVDESAGASVSYLISPAVFSGTAVAPGMYTITYTAYSTTWFGVAPQCTIVVYIIAGTAGDSYDMCLHSKFHIQLRFNASDYMYIDTHAGGTGTGAGMDSDSDSDADAADSVVSEDSGDESNFDVFEQVSAIDGIVYDAVLIDEDTHYCYVSAIAETDYQTATASEALVSFLGVSSVNILWEILILLFVLIIIVLIIDRCVVSVCDGRDCYRRKYKADEEIESLLPSDKSRESKLLNLSGIASQTQIRRATLNTEAQNSRNIDMAEAGSDEEEDDSDDSDDSDDDSDDSDGDSDDDSDDSDDDSDDDDSEESTDDGKERRAAKKKRNSEYKKQLNAKKPPQPPQPPQPPRQQNANYNNNNNNDQHESSDESSGPAFVPSDLPPSKPEPPREQQQQLNVNALPPPTLSSQMGSDDKSDEDNNQNNYEEDYDMDI